MGVVVAVEDERAFQGQTSRKVGFISSTLGCIRSAIRLSGFYFCYFVVVV